MEREIECEVCGADGASDWDPKPPAGMKLCCDCASIPNQHLVKILGKFRLNIRTMMKNQKRFDAALKELGV